MITNTNNLRLFFLIKMMSLPWKLVVRAKLFQKQQSDHICSTPVRTSFCISSLYIHVRLWLPIRRYYPLDRMQITRFDRTIPSTVWFSSSVRGLPWHAAIFLASSVFRLSTRRTGTCRWYRVALDYILSS